MSLEGLQWELDKDSEPVNSCPVDRSERPLWLPACQQHDLRVLGKGMFILDKGFIQLKLGVMGNNFPSNLNNYKDTQFETFPS